MYMKFGGQDDLFCIRIFGFKSSKYSKRYIFLDVNSKLK